VEVRAGHFSEGVFEAIPEDVYLCGSAALALDLRSNRAQPKRRQQISQDDSRNPINIATRFAHRQPDLCASYEQPAASAALLKITTASRLEILHKHTRLTGNHESEEGEWVGPLLSILES
jgi:hypothetical protein